MNMAYEDSKLVRDIMNSELSLKDFLDLKLQIGKKNNAPYISNVEHMLGRCLIHAFKKDANVDEYLNAFIQVFQGMKIGFSIPKYNMKEFYEDVVEFYLQLLLNEEPNEKVVQKEDEIMDIISSIDRLKKVTEGKEKITLIVEALKGCLLYTSPSPRD